MSKIYVIYNSYNLYDLYRLTTEIMELYYYRAELLNFDFSFVITNIYLQKLQPVYF